MKYKHHLLLYLFCFVSSLSVLHAQIDTLSHPYFPVVLSDTKRFFEDAGLFFTSPLRFSGNDWLLTGGVLVGTTGLFLIDDEARTLMQNHQTKVASNVAEIGRIYGENYFGVGLTAGIYGVGLFTKNKDVRETGFLVFESVAFSAVITHSVKVIIGRSRPYTNNGSTDFTPFSFPEDHVSLPSGHATAAFAISSVLSEKIDNPYASAGLYTLATCTAVSRVYDDVHWLSDVALGSAIGYLTGKAVLHLYEEGNSTQLGVFPSPTGVHIIYRF